MSGSEFVGIWDQSVARVLFETAMQSLAEWEVTAQDTYMYRQYLLTCWIIIEELLSDDDQLWGYNSVDWGSCKGLSLNRTNRKDSGVRLRTIKLLVNHVLTCYKRQGNEIICNELPFSTVGWVIARGTVSFGVRILKVFSLFFFLFLSFFF